MERIFVMNRLVYTFFGQWFKCVILIYPYISGSNQENVERIFVMNRLVYKFFGQWFKCVILIYPYALVMMST